MGGFFGTCRTLIALVLGGDNVGEDGIKCHILGTEWEEVGYT